MSPSDRGQGSAPGQARAEALSVLAFYLPQFHTVPENDAWWGAGFTEWRNVVKARPLFPGHEQPRLPGELGFYDLRLPETREQQAVLARRHGIDGFAYYHYWFHGRRMLQRPWEEVRSSGAPDFPFCLIWANENWTRTWDAGQREMLIAQTYSPEDDDAHGRYLVEQFGDDRYIRVAGRPLLGVYRVQALPDPQRTFDHWRSLAVAAGVGEPYIVKFDTWSDFGDPADHGCDASAEFPPHGVFEHLPAAVRDDIDPVHALIDYGDVVRFFVERPDPTWTRHPTVVPSWDNTPRKPQGPSVVLLGRDPAWFQEWVEGAIARAIRSPHPLVFVNAWNEWAEGAYLEPDEAWGRAFLEAISAARLAAGLPSSSVSEPARSEVPPPATTAELYADLYERDLELQHAHVELQGFVQRRVEASTLEARRRIADLEAELERWRPSPS